jgi:hypothetical protein
MNNLAKKIAQINAKRKHTIGFSEEEFHESNKRAVAVIRENARIAKENTKTNNK